MVLTTFAFSIFSLIFSIIYFPLAFAVGVGGAIYENSQGDRIARNLLIFIAAAITTIWLSILTIYGIV